MWGGNKCFDIGSSSGYNDATNNLIPKRRCQPCITITTIITTMITTITITIMTTIITTITIITITTMTAAMTAAAALPSASTPPWTNCWR